MEAQEAGSDGDSGCEESFEFFGSPRSMPPGQITRTRWLRNHASSLRILAPILLLAVTIAAVVIDSHPAWPWSRTSRSSRAASVLQRLRSISAATHPQVLEEISEDDNAGWGDGDVVMAKSLLEALGNRAEEVAPEMQADDVANVLDAYVTLDETPNDDLLKKLGARATQVAPKMRATDVAKTFHAYADFVEQPTDGLWGALGQQAEIVAGKMNAQELANTLSAHVVLNHRPSHSLLTSLAARAEEVALQMGPQDVASVLLAFSHFGQDPGESVWRALGQAALKVAPQMSARNCIDTINAYSNLGKQPDKALWAALSSRTAQVAPQMLVEDVIDTLSAYVQAYDTLKRRPSKVMIDAVGKRAEDKAPEMSARHISVAFSEYAHLEKLRQANQPLQIPTEGKAPTGSENAQDSKAEEEKQPQAEAYNCNDGYSKWEMTWVVAKQEWCCQHHGKACWTTTTKPLEVGSEAEQVQERVAAAVGDDNSNGESGLPDGQMLSPQ